MEQEGEASEQSAAREAPPTLVVSPRYEDSVVVLRADTGAILWRRTIDGRLGTFAHGGEAVYLPVSTPIPMPTSTLLALRDLPAEEQLRRRRSHAAHPAHVVALGARDGALLWLEMGWGLSGHARLVLDGDLLFGDVPALERGVRTVSAREARTGALLWTHDSGDPFGSDERLITARAGRVYVRHQRDQARRLEVLDGRSGGVLWEHAEQEPLWIRLSEGGELVVIPASEAPDGPMVAAVYRAADGSRAASAPLPGVPQVLTDDGIACFSRHASYQRRRLVQSRLWAVQVSDGRELWHIDGVSAHRAIISGGMLYYALLIETKRRAEVGAVEARSGKLLWRWRSPANLAGLLTTWGCQTPAVLAFALKRGYEALTAARKRHDRNIFWREWQGGQWRHPAALDQAPNAMQLVSGWGGVYLATSIGLFALRASDGHLLWHALPTTDLTLKLPAIAPGD